MSGYFGGSSSIGPTTPTDFTEGSVIFAGASTLDENNTAFFWDGTNTQLKLVAGAATKTPLLVKGAGSQSANLAEWQNSSGSVVANVTATGALVSTGNVSAGNFLLASAGLLLSDNYLEAVANSSWRFRDTVASPWFGFVKSSAAIQLTDGASGIKGLVGGGSAVASATALPLPTGRVFHVTGTTTITSITSTNFQSGAVITLIFDDVLTFTDGSNLKLAGNFVTTADDTITLAYDGTNWYEIARSVN